MKKVLCLILVLVLIASCSGCFGLPFIVTKPTEQPAVTDSPAPTPEPEPTRTPATAPTPAPTEDTSASADEAFRELDLELFRMLVTSSADSYNQYIVSDPEAFGIDPADVEQGWGEYTYESHVESMDYYRMILSRLNEIDRDRLSEMNRYGWEAIKRFCEKQLLFEDYYYYDEPLEPINGLQSMLPLSMTCFVIRNADDIGTYLALVEDMPRFIGQIARFEEEKAAQGLFMCEEALDGVLDSIENITDKGDKSVFITYFESDVIEKARELGLSESECAELIARNRTAVLDGILPAYMNLASVLESHRGDCLDYTGACGISDRMRDYYVLKLQYEGATMDSFDIIEKLLTDMGDSVFSDLTRAITYGYYDVLPLIGTPVSMGSIDDNIAWLEDFIKIYYPELPEYSLTKLEVPDDIADDFSPAAYLMPAFDDYYNNTMLVNPKSESAGDLPTVAHETIPGHMYQYLYARSTEGLSLTQQILEPTGYAEGWTVFTEYFVSNNCTDINRYFCIMSNADSVFCNIFLPAYVSILVNYYGYTLEEVADYLSDYSMEDAAEVFYDYAIIMPYYAMNYAIGYAYMLSIYQSASPRSPQAHKDFFAKYLSFGPCDMDMMREYMG